MTIYAYTATKDEGGYQNYPHYVNVKRDGERDVIVTVRGPEDLTGENPQMGQHAACSIPLYAARDMAFAILREVGITELLSTDFSIRIVAR